MLTHTEGRNARSQLKLSQSEVASETGINRSYISLFEVGKYTLDDDEQERLRQFYEARGYTFDAKSGRDDRRPIAAKASAGAVVAVDAANTRKTDAERTASAIEALAELRQTADSTGVDSKRTVAALATARDALVKLDYPELLSIANTANTSLQGVPGVEEFQELPTADKETHENRAACVLLCWALYGAAWKPGDAPTWERVGRALVHGGWLSEDERPTHSIFAGEQAIREYSRRCRVCLAPALVRAAEQRRPLSLTPDQDRKRGGWAFITATP